MQTLNTTDKTTPRSTMPTPPQEDFLLIKNVKKSFPIADGGGEYVVLDGVNLTVKQGEFICVIGPA
jgi:ABC-type protease/lipase transport system fused ATPase/permease subunit